MTRPVAGVPSYIFVFGLSLVLHVGVVGLGLVQWPFSKPLHVRLDQPVVYQVDLVTLAPPAPGWPMPARQAAPASATPLPAKPVPVHTPLPAPLPKAEVKIPEQPKPAPPPAKPTPKPEPAKPAPAPVKAPPKKAEPTRDQVLAEALGAARQDVARRATDERAQALAGLRQELASRTRGADGSPGGVAVGSLVEVYARIVESQIKANWRYPQVGAWPDLSAIVEVQIGRDGRILSSKVVRSSGRPDFDASTERAVEETGRLPAPPRPDLHTLRITFNLQEL